MRGFTIIFLHLYNKNILEYAQILVTSGRFMIFHIEGHSSIKQYIYQTQFNKRSFEVTQVQESAHLKSITMTELNNTKNIIKVIEWLIFIGLCILSVFLTHEVLVQFLLKRTSFKMYEEKITDHPTITICYSRDQKEYFPNYRYGSNFGIEYKHISLEEGKNYYEPLNQTIGKLCHV